MTDKTSESEGDEADAGTSGLAAAARASSQLGKFLAASQVHFVPPKIMSSTAFANLFASSPFQEQIAGLNKLVVTSLFQEQVAALNKQVAAMAFGKIDFSTAPWLAQLRDQQKTIAEGLLGQFRGSFQPLIDHNFFRKLEVRFLPPNLQAVSGQVSPIQVLAFLEEEGIPLYLVPRASVAARLLRAPDHAKRRRVLNDCFDQIVEDCEAVLAGSTGPLTATEVRFTLDGVGAIHSGHYAAAQALFTVTLDTLVARLLDALFSLSKQKRGPITRRRKGAAVPALIDDMGVRDSYVWLPVWNAHGEFWEHKGDRIPHDYSRHATVHAVSRTQYSKRNCVQALMLVTSLIGYTETLARESQTS